MVAHAGEGRARRQVKAAGKPYMRLERAHEEAGADFSQKPCENKGI
jgi:hypothetical protein